MFLHDGMSSVKFQKTEDPDSWELLGDGHIFQLIMIIMVLDELFFSGVMFH